MADHSLIDDVLLDPDRCYRAVTARDARFDGWFIVGVRTTGIYCRPSCPTPVQPMQKNVTFHRTAAAAQRTGLRACKRCRPDATPGSPAWDLRADLVGRAMRLIADGAVDRQGVAGLARELAVSSRHLNRVLNDELGAGPLAIARAHRAQTARVLIETTDLGFAEVAFASGFSSVRQFNDTVREVFDRTPTQLRGRGGAGMEPGSLVLRLPHRGPFEATTLFSWLAQRAIAGVSWTDGTAFVRTLDLPRSHGLVRLEPADGHVRCQLHLDDVGDLAVAVARLRRLLDLDADPVAVDDVLSSMPSVAALVARRPGLRVPGTVDGFETAVFAVLAQQVSLVAATTFAARVAERHGREVEVAGQTCRLFPRADELVDAPLDDLGLTGRRRETIRTLARAVLDGLPLHAGADRAEVRSRLLALPGVGPWTADYLLMRALGDPDVLPVGDLVIRRRAASIGLPERASELAAAGVFAAPWRSYLAHHLWSHTPDEEESP